MISKADVIASVTRRAWASRRQGTIHVLVLLSALIVAAIGLSSLQLLRVQAKTAAGEQDFSQARLHARSAVELGLLKIRQDPFWRRNLGNGNWLTDVAMGAGTATLSAVDPIDNDVKNGDNHPVVLIGTGKQGNAVFMTSVRLEVGPPKNSCLEVSLTSGHDLKISNATLTGNQSICANHNVSASSAQVNADVEAAGSMGGSAYGKSLTSLSATRTLPDPATVLNYYLSQGTTIAYTSLPVWTQTELLTNTGYENNTSDWLAYGSCVLSRSNSTRVSGGWSLLVSNRAANSAVAAQSVPISNLRCGDTYQIRLPIRSSACQAQATIILNSTGNGLQAWTTPLQDVPANTWTTLTGNLTPTWTGTLNQALVAVSLNTTGDYFQDEVSLINVTYPTGYYVLDGLLSPTSNPYGAANSQGIYIIACNGQNVLIGRSRIVGTLVFLDPGANTTVEGPTNWEPAIYNYPALLSNNTMNIAMTSSGFSEATYGANLNPPGTPYPYNGGTSNSTLTDNFPAKITGLIYSANQLKIARTSSIDGVVIAHDDLEVNATSLTLNYSHVYLNDAPPGFTNAAITMKVVPGSWRRKVN